MTNTRDEKIEVGDIYEDSAYHPCLTVGVDYEEDDIWGISLIDGSYPRSCSLKFSGVRKLTVDEAWNIKMNWNKIQKKLTRIKRNFGSDPSLKFRVSVEFEFRSD